MAYPEDDNKPEETLTETPEETPEPSETPETDTSTEPASSKKEGSETEQEQVQEFLSLEDKEAMDEYLQMHPNLKPVIDHLHKAHKNMQAGFTKAMQNVPKKYRDGKLLTQMEQSHQILEKMRSTPGFEAALNEIISKGQGAKTETVKEETTGKIEDLIAKHLPDVSDEEREGLKRIFPVLEDFFGSKLKPLTEQSAKAEEQAEKQKLASDKKFSGIDVEDFWDDAKKLRQNNPTLSWKQALALAIDECEVFVDAEGNEYHSVDEYRQAQGKKEGLTTKKPAGKGSFVVGGTKEADKSLRTYSQAELDAMTPEEYEEKMGLKRV